MKRRTYGLLAIAVFAIADLFGSGQSLAQNAYITNFNDNTVSVIDTRSNSVTATIAVGGIGNAFGVAVSPDGSKVYITNSSSEGRVSVIDTATNSVITKFKSVASPSVWRLPGTATRSMSPTRPPTPYRS